MARPEQPPSRQKKASTCAREIRPQIMGGENLQPMIGNLTQL
jgi:hypothetical protein